MELLDLIDRSANVSIPIVITLLAVWFIWKVANDVPKTLTEYMNGRKKASLEQSNRYDSLQTQFQDQMRIITAVAQQGIEAQKRGNEVIERNNILMESNQRVIEKINISLDSYCEAVEDLRAEIKEEIQMSQKSYTEIIRLSEIMKK